MNLLLAKVIIIISYSSTTISQLKKVAPTYPESLKSEVSPKYYEESLNLEALARPELSPKDKITQKDNVIQTDQLSQKDNNVSFNYDDLGDHTIVMKNGVFPYVAAILRRSKYLSAGALIHESWVLTGGDSLYLLRESSREIRVRLGSINFRKGGFLTPIKFFEIHPFFTDFTAEFDIAMIKLPEPVELTSHLYPIPLQNKLTKITATHFTVTSWSPTADKQSAELQMLQSMETIQRRRTLTVSHLHPANNDQCLDELSDLDINATNTLICLEPPLSGQACSRDIGAPVVLEGVLWGIVSSWKPEDCKVVNRPSFVTLVAAKAVRSWIHSNLKGHKYNETYRVENDTSYNDYYAESGNESEQDYNQF